MPLPVVSASVLGRPSRRWLAPATAILLTSLTAGPPAVAADSVVLESGETLQGEITSQSETVINFKHPVLGPLVIPREQVKSLVDSNPEPPAAAEPAPEPLPEPAFGPSQWILPGFEKNLEAGINGSDGNTETLNLYANFNAQKKTESDRWDIVSKYFRSSDDGDTSENNFSLQVTKDWLLSDSAFFYFARGKYEYDQFESWEHRVSSFGGVGYTFYDEKDFELRGRAGAGAIYEFGNVNELTWEGVLGIEGVYRISDSQEFTFSNTLLPSLSEGGEYRNLTSLAYSIALDTAKGMSLKFGIENEYDSDPAPGDEQNDIKYFGALVLSF
ncbi:MAG: DUF481 domain-containing protein [Planctomycetota bacterium]